MKDEYSGSLNLKYLRVLNFKSLAIHKCLVLQLLQKVSST